MKRNWEVKELVEYWTLLSSELALLGSKTGATRLGFAVSLKYFQLETKFPAKKPDIPFLVLSHLAAQVNVPSEEYQEYDWHTRSSRYHRHQIREYFGFRACVATDIKTLFDWLVKKVLSQEADLEHLKQIVAERFLNLKVEPPTDGRIERLIRSAIHTYETNFFQTIHLHLSAESRTGIDILLDTSDLEEENSTKPSLFQYLNSEPGRASLDNLLSEIIKLEHLRKIGLPDKLFANVSPKVLQNYARCAATEPPREIRSHPEPIRYTLVAAFCWLRMREVTDNLVDLLIQIVHGIGTRAEKRVDAQLVKWRSPSVTCWDSS